MQDGLCFDLVQNFWTLSIQIVVAKLPSLQMFFGNNLDLRGSFPCSDANPMKLDSITVSFLCKILGELCEEIGNLMTRLKFRERLGLFGSIKILYRWNNFLDFLEDRLFALLQLFQFRHPSTGQIGG